MPLPRNSSNKSTLLNRNRGSKPATSAGSTSSAATSSLAEVDRRNDQLAEEMLRLASNMKSNFTLAGSVIRSDNSSLDAMQRTTVENTADMSREGRRLEHHAYNSCCDCAFVLIVVFVIWSFICAVLFMKFFPKRY